ncbi:MAG: hypothetical protein SCM57_08255, partial [Bacillota bacterium]|nr:hypothetical protein [Bacillota bacterium]
AQTRHLDREEIKEAKKAGEKGNKNAPGLLKKQEPAENPEPAEQATAESTETEEEPETEIEVEEEEEEAGNNSNKPETPVGPPANGRRNR